MTTTAEKMAKQRSVNLPPELYELADAYEARTGASFNRQAIAAFLQWFLSKPEGPDVYWMGLAVALQKGEITWAELFRRQATQAYGELRSIENDIFEVFNAQGKTASEAAEDDLPLALGAHLNTLEHIQRRLKSQWDQWSAIAKAAGKDAPQELINHWKRDAERCPQFEDAQREVGSDSE